ncbi:MAG TPA: 3-phosphoshikimate 1-carboxyvinyltransferase [Pseudogracilibacillus sp.]|nr:3-phosphoshikimate 1-carboxyvinyltransferase [Pseudogracilibacillus sp.]
MEKKLKPIAHPLHGELIIPGDKSISHRAIILGSIAEGRTKINNFLSGEDCLRTIDIFRSFGVQIEQNDTDVVIQSQGVTAFTEPKEPLYFGNSGTTARLMIGLLAGLPFHTVVYGDPHLTERPMDRVVLPLKEMGANIDGRKNGTLLPIAIRGKQLRGINYTLPVKSAQVKSALLLAGLFAETTTQITEQALTRDHTENMLRAYGVPFEQDGLTMKMNKQSSFHAVNLTIPGDISSAAFFLTAGAIVPGSKLTLKQVGLNPTRTGIIEVLQKMGASIVCSNERTEHGEKLGDITITYQTLKATEIAGDLIPKMIDEIPVAALIATQAEGSTVIKDAKELRVKETDRIKAVVEVLKTLGANVEEREDGMVIHGKTDLTGGNLKSYSDHRMAMMGVIASFITKEEVVIDDISPISISYPDFFKHIEQIS